MGASGSASCVGGSIGSTGSGTGKTDDSWNWIFGLPG